MRLLTIPGVFRPRSDAWLLAGLLHERGLARDRRVLDVFTGSGVLAIAAARAGASAVTAVDLSRRAAACAWLNGRLNGARLRVLRGDLLEPVAGDRFDLITANPPYVPGPAELPRRGAARAWEGGSDGRALLERFCDLAPEHLAPGGEIVLVQSALAGDELTVEQLEGKGLRCRVLARERGPLGPLVAARAAELEQRGLLRPGQRDEEMVVIAAGPP